jgi:pSer/pThr/pTyr-binding forkhead associated (FHA) protein
MPDLPATVSDGTGERSAPEDTGSVPGRLVLDEPGGAAVLMPSRGEPAIVVGRDPSCAVAVPFDDTHVSRRHAQLAWFSSGWWLVMDLCSSNGTIVGGEQVVEPIPITVGQFLQVGRTVYRVEAGEPQ